MKHTGAIIMVIAAIAMFALSATLYARNALIDAPKATNTTVESGQNSGNGL